MTIWSDERGCSFFIKFHSTKNITWVNNPDGLSTYKPKKEEAEEERRRRNIYIVTCFVGYLCYY